jgi:hypothetical protein
VVSTQSTTRYRNRIFFFFFFFGTEEYQFSKQIKAKPHIEFIESNIDI